MVAFPFEFAQRSFDELFSFLLVPAELLNKLAKSVIQVCLIQNVHIFLHEAVLLINFRGNFANIVHSDFSLGHSSRQYNGPYIFVCSKLPVELNSNVSFLQ